MTEPRPLLELLGEAETLIRQRQEWPKQASANLRAARTAAGLSQGAVAAAAGVSRNYVSMVENGAKSISSETFAALTGAITTLASTGGSNSASSQVSVQVQAQADAQKARSRSGK